MNDGFHQSFHSSRYAWNNEAWIYERDRKNAEGSFYGGWDQYLDYYGREKYCTSWKVHRLISWRRNSSSDLVISTESIYWLRLWLYSDNKLEFTNPLLKKTQFTRTSKRFNQSMAGSWRECRAFLILHIWSLGWRTLPSLSITPEAIDLTQTWKPTVELRTPAPLLVWILIPFFGTDNIQHII